uniref:HTH_48 domain-containing protein n=1 Tax=Haemonchus contortus TaxID=6289 RepID=A0A7I4Z3K1_HAECO
MKEVYEKVARCTIYKWHSKFTSDDYSFEDEDRPGLSIEMDLDVLRSQVEADSYQTTRELAATRGVSQFSVIRGLKSIGTVQKLGRWVLHALKQYDMDCRANMALSLLTLGRWKRSDVFVVMYLKELFILYLTMSSASIFVTSFLSYDLYGHYYLMF